MKKKWKLRGVRRMAKVIYMTKLIETHPWMKFNYAEIELRILAHECWCYRCDEAGNTSFSAMLRSRMNLCPECGNKRCPRATDHNLACTGSNEPGQPGSIYA